MVLFGLAVGQLLVVGLLFDSMLEGVRSVPTSYVGPVRGVQTSLGVVGWALRGFPSNGTFSSLSLDFLKLSSYSQIGGPVTTRSVPASYIGPVRGDRSPKGAIWGALRGFAL